MLSIESTLENNPNLTITQPVAAPVEPDRLRARVILQDAGDDHAAEQRADIYLPKERLVKVDHLMTFTRLVRVLAHCYSTAEDG